MTGLQVAYARLYHPAVMLRRPLPLAMLLGLVAQALFLIRVAVPHQLVFDEVHYVPAARALWALQGPRNIEHPLLGKALIGLSMRLLGDDSLGWRAASTVAGTAVVVGMFAIAWLLWGRPRLALTAGLLVLLNMTTFVQARIAMLDGFMAAFLVTGLACLLWAVRGQTRARAWWRWLAGAALLGLAIGCKWTALPYLGFAGAGLAALRRRRPGAAAALRLVPAGTALAGVAGGTYLLTFAPAFFYAEQPLTLATLLPFQATMFHQQTQVLPPHPYQSSWWTWPLMIRPIWYLYERADGAQRGILMLGNPAVLWGGLVAVGACAWRWTRGDWRAGAVAALWLGSVAMWAAIPKSLGFFYYSYPSTIWIALPIAAAFDGLGPRWRYWDEAYLALTGALFVYFFPIVAALPLAGSGAFLHWMWLKSWP